MLLFLILLCASFFTHGMNSDSSAGEETGYFSVTVSGLEIPIKMPTKETPTVGEIRSALKEQSGEEHYALESISESDIEEALKNPTKNDSKLYEGYNFAPKKNVLNLIETRLEYNVKIAKRKLAERERTLEMFRKTYIK